MNVNVLWVMEVNDEMLCKGIVMVNTSVVEDSGEFAICHVVRHGNASDTVLILNGIDVAVV